MLIRPFLLILLSSACLASDYYVDPAGDDSRDGLSEKNAWKTLARVQQQPLKPGDNVKLAAKGVWRESLRLTRSGTEGKPITVASTSEIPAVISGADETGKPVRDVCLDIAASHIKIDSLHLTAAAAPQRGAIMIWADQDREGITISRTEISRSRGRGIWIAGDEGISVKNVTITACDIYDNDGSGMQIAKLKNSVIAENTLSRNCLKRVDEWQAAIRLWSSDINSVDIRNNRIRRMGENDAMGIHIDEVGPGVSVTGNVIASCGGAGIEVENTRGVTVARNDITNVHTGIFVYRAGHGHLIERNTVHARELGIVLQGHRANGVNAGPEIEVEKHLLTGNEIRSNLVVTQKWSPLKVVGGAETVKGELANIIQGNCFGPEKRNLVEWGGKTLSTYAELDQVAGPTQSIPGDPQFMEDHPGVQWHRVDQQNIDAGAQSGNRDRVPAPSRPGNATSP